MHYGKEWCMPTIKTAAWLLLFIVFCVQLFTIVQVECLIGRLMICDTLFMLVLKINECPFVAEWFAGKSTKHNNHFLGVVASLITEALLFVNLTHSIEVVFCAEPDSKFTLQFLVITTLSVLVKLVLFALHRVERLNMACQLLFHTAAPLGALILFLVNHLYSSTTNYYLTLMDPFFTIALSVVISIVTLPILFSSLPVLLCNIPSDGNADEIKMELEKMFPTVHCTHLHIFNDTVILHVSLDVEDSEVTHATAVKNAIRDITAWLKKRGMHKVTIQPHISPGGEKKLLSAIGASKSVWKSCITTKCSMESGCCIILK